MMFGLAGVTMTQDYFQIARMALLLSVTLMSACASDAPVEQRDDMADGEIAAALACTPSQVAVCMDVNCEPDEFSCVEREDARKLFRADDHWHR